VEDVDLYNGYEAINCFNAIIRNCRIYSPDAWGGSFYAKGGARNFQAYNNVIYMLGGSNRNGLVLGGSTGASMLFEPNSGIEGYNQVAYNNVVHVTGLNQYGYTGIALGFKGCKNCVMYNNVVVGGMLYADGPSLNPVYRNNIISCNGAEGTLQPDVRIQ